MGGKYVSNGKTFHENVKIAKKDIENLDKF